MPAHAHHGTDQKPSARRCVLPVLLAFVVICALTVQQHVGVRSVALVVLDHIPTLIQRSSTVNYQMPPRLDKQDCIKAGATCTIRISGGYLQLTDIVFPDGESEPGSAEADGVVNGKHVHGVVHLKGNQLPSGHFIPARDDPEPYMAAREQASEQEGETSEQESDAVAVQDDHALPGNGSAILQFSSRYGGTVVKRSRADLRRGGGLDSQYTKAVSTMVGNLRRQHEKVSVAEDQIANAVEQVITSHAVSSSIASLALKVADERAMQEDGNTFLEPKAQQLAVQEMGKSQHKQAKKVLPRLRAAVAAVTALQNGGGGVMGAIAQALAAKGKGGAGEEFEPTELIIDKEGRKGLPASYPESGFPEQATANKSWNDAMQQWGDEGIAAKPDYMYPELASGAAMANPHQLGLSALALQTLARNPAAGVTGPAAGAFGGLWTQKTADEHVEAAQNAIARGYNEGQHSADYGAMSSPYQVCVCVCVCV